MSNTHFADVARMNAAEFSAPVRSLMDIDFYKFTMGQVIWQYYPDVEVTFKLIIRDKDIPVGEIIPEDQLRESLDYVRDLTFSRTDIYYLRGMNLHQDYMFKEGYLDFLRTLKLPPYRLVRKGKEIELSFTGKWAEVSMWETIALAVISELYYRAVMKTMSKHELELVYARAMDKLSRKLEELQKFPRITFSDFGQRRRHSFLWQEWAIGLAKSMMGEQFIGTSNTWMAFRHDLSPIGTNAHEMPMVLVALAPDKDKVDAQYEPLRLWEKTYNQSLRIFLPDTYGTKQFLDNAPECVAAWRGMRQDSNDPVSRGRMYINWLRKWEIDPKSKLMIPSDGLDVESMKRIDRELGDEINLSDGWGSLFTNDFRGTSSNLLLRPFSMVCKVVRANDFPCIKLSDNLDKVTGPKEEIERYKKIFGVEGLSSSRVYV
ncbi:MAG: nicotinate phosphoribosyltransferase [Parcubacteria group bacterium]|nr:nicotinate phosphoribosyltransferase [Parcubacteria group bacterium]